MYGTTAKFKSANVFISAAQDQTAKFKDCQYFRLYGIIQTGKCTWKSLQTSTQQHQLQLTTQLMYYYSPNQTNLEWKLNNTFFTHLWQSKFHSLAVDDHLLGRVSHLLLYEPQQVLLVHTRGGVNVSIHLQGGSEETRAISALTCVSSERTPTLAGTSDSMFTMWKKFALTWSVKLNIIGIWEWGIIMT